MIDSLDNILADLIQSQVPALAKTGQIGFDAPNEEWRRDVVNTNAERVNIYLFDVRENLKLRSNERRRELQKNGWYSERDDRPKLNCMYLVTAWSHMANMSPTIEATSDEHSLLYAVAEVLFRHRSIVVADVYNQGITIPSGNSLAKLPAEGLPDTMRDLGDFWSTMQGVWRPALQLTVALPLFPLAQPFESPMVTTASADYRQQGEPESAEVWLSIGGHILAPKSALPVLGAYVEIQGLNPPVVQKIKHHLTTASDGRFLFSFLRAGDYRLQAVASGLGPVTRNLTLPSPTGEYDLQF